MKSFNEFLSENIIRRVSKNAARAKSLEIESARKFSSLNEMLTKIGIKKENANDYVEYCYDIIMHLLRAKLYLGGYSASGEGAHEAEISYLRVLEFPENDVKFADQMRYFRNGILYYGNSFDEEYADKVVKFTKRIYPILRKKII